MKSILITGARSKLIQPVIKHFYDQGTEITLISKNKLDHSSYSKIKSFEIDLYKGIDLDLAPDLIIHAAAVVPYNSNIKIKDSDILSQNIRIFNNVLDFAVNKKVKKMIFLSSIDVYGQRRDDEISEDDFCEPENMYGFSKLACEELLETYGHLFSLNYSILRIGAAFGRGMSENLKIYKMLKTIKEEKKIKLFNPQSTHSLISVEDVADAIIASTESNTCKVNITGLPISLHDFFSQAFAYLNIEEDIKEIESSEAPLFLKFNLKAAKDHLNWQPSSNNHSAFHNFFSE
jgi:UDP-glucose 4-epimerase